jgi:hypothetical protein
MLDNPDPTNQVGAAWGRERTPFCPDCSGALRDRENLYRPAPCPTIDKSRKSVERHDLCVDLRSQSWASSLAADTLNCHGDNLVQL